MNSELIDILADHTKEIVESKIFQSVLSEDFEFTSSTVIGFQRLPGASNLTYRVDFVWEEKKHSIIIRKFKNLLVDFRIENFIFQELSNTDQGPFWFVQNKKYRQAHSSKLSFRIEEYLSYSKNKRNFQFTFLLIFNIFFLASRTLSIFELRNPHFMSLIIQEFASFHKNLHIQQEVIQILKEVKGDKYNITCLHSFLSNWYLDLKDRIPLIRQKLLRDDYKEILSQFWELYLTEDFEEYWTGMLPKGDKNVVAHTDAQETNFLVVSKDSRLGNGQTKLVLIDYEYTGIVPRSWELANYYIETMLSNNEYDGYPFVEVFEENKMEKDELDRMVNLYLELLGEDADEINRDEFI